MIRPPGKPEPLGVDEMAYLRWSYSNWYVYSHVDAGDLDDAALACLHGRHSFFLTAGELRRQAADPNGL